MLARAHSLPWKPTILWLACLQLTLFSCSPPVLHAAHCAELSSQGGGLGAVGLIYRHPTLPRQHPCSWQNIPRWGREGSGQALPASVWPYPRSPYREKTNSHLWINGPLGSSSSCLRVPGIGLRRAFFFPLVLLHCKMCSHEVLTNHWVIYFPVCGVERRKWKQLCWNRTKTAVGQACRGLAGNLTMQTPRNQTTDAKALHTNKAHVLPVLLVGTFEEEHTPSTLPVVGAAVNQEARAADSVPSHLLLSSWLVRWEKLRNAHREKNKISKCGQNSNYFFPLVGYEKWVVDIEG